MNPPKLLIDHVYKTFKIRKNDVQALEDIYMEIREGEFVCLVGPSGCGKSTLLNLIAGLDFPDQGMIYDNEISITEPSSERMVMFQEAALFPWLDVLNNVLFGLNLKKNLSSFDRLELATDYLQLVGLEKFMHAHVHELSGGMKQRVALARALAPNPHLLLMDEPFSALDAFTREQLYEDIQNIFQKQRKTIIFVTHNVTEAVCLGDRVFLFASNPGRIQKEFFIPLPRSREIRSVEVAQYATEITHILKKNSFEARE